MNERRRFVWWPRGRPEWSGVAGNVIAIVFGLLLVLGYGLVKTAPTGILILLPLPWVGYRLVKVIRKHSRGAAVLAISALTLGLAAAGYMAASAATAERAKREGADLESFRGRLMKLEREEREECLSKTVDERREAEMRRIVLRTGRPWSVIRRHFDEYASPDWNCGIR